MLVSALLWHDAVLLSIRFSTLPDSYIVSKRRKIMYKNSVKQNHIAEESLLHPHHCKDLKIRININPYPTAFPYGNAVG